MKELVTTQQQEVGLASAQEVLEHATFLKDLRILTPHSMTLRSEGKRLTKK